MREKIFSDRLVYASRQLRAAFFLTLSFLSAFWLYHRVQYVHYGLTEKLISTDRLLYQSLQHFYARQYEDSRALSAKVLERDPKNAEALYQLAAAQFMLDDVRAGEASWEQARKADPDSLQGNRLKSIILQVKHSTSPVLQ